MEFVDGGTLHEWYQRQKDDSPRYFREVADIIAQVAHVLQYAHSAGVIHRDVKPSNILLDRSGRPRLADFGIARTRDAEEASRA